MDIVGGKSTISMSTRIFYFLAWVAILMGFVLIGLVTFWFIYPYSVVTFNDRAKFEVINPVIKRGGTLFFKTHYCKTMALPARVSRQFINDLIFLVPTTTTNRTTGCHDSIVGILIPTELPPGRYYLHNIYQFQVNPIRTITVERDTDDFIVE